MWTYLSIFYYIWLLGAVILLVLCLQEPELYIKQISASAISDISKHSLELAQVVVDAGAIYFLVKILANIDPKAKVIWYILNEYHNIQIYIIFTASSIVSTE